MVVGLCIRGRRVVLGAAKMCETCLSTATRAIRAPLLWCWALRSKLAPLGALVELTWCATTVGKRAIISVIAGCFTGSHRTPNLHLLTKRPSDQKTEFRQLQDDRAECVSAKEDLFAVAGGQH